jgi:UDP-N-acetylmuramoyl-L-alanyl-D-glutamate--2,6-diaminopimelate ligase
MGEVSSRLADVVVLTSDNPRSEDPMAIIGEIRAGLGAGTEVVVEPDRARAIRLAVGLAEPGDVVVVAGKGHEQVLEIGRQRLPFDDRRVAAAAAHRRFGPQAGHGDGA